MSDETNDGLDGRDTVASGPSEKELAAQRAMEDATRLAAQGLYRCKVCGKVNKQETGLLIAFAGNVLLAVCPTCIHAPIVIQRQPHGLSINFQQRAPGSITVARSMREVEGMHLAKPKVGKVTL